MRGTSALIAVLSAAALGLAAPGAARADDAAAPAVAGVGVARISFLSGKVSLQRGDATTAEDAVLNAPLLGGDYVTTGDDSRAEVQFDGTTVMRLGHDVQARFAHLDAANRDVQLAEGTVELRLFRGVDGKSTIDTPSVTVTPDEGGTYRVSVDGDGVTRVVVRSGRADVQTPQGAQAVTPGTTLIAQGPASNPQITTGEALALDDFDRFNGDRDARLAPIIAAAQAPVDPRVNGAADLAAYGRWLPDPIYGEVWVPNGIAPAWAPYRDGRWVWEGPYGWTWVAAEPWGWAPYHYGRWYHSPVYGWAWTPPPPAPVVPVWQPALVAFFSFGHGGTSVAIGNVGWVPLAPSEPYRPWWRPGRPAIVNVTNVTNVTNVNVVRVYRNANYGAVSGIDARRFLSGHFANAVVAVPPEQLARTRFSAGAAPVAPTAASLRFHDRPAVAAVPVRTATFAQRTFAGRAPETRERFQAARPAVVAPAAIAPARMPQPATPTNARPDAWSRFSAGRPAAAAPREARSGPSYSRTETPRSVPAPAARRPVQHEQPREARAQPRREEPARPHDTGR